MNESPVYRRACPECGNLVSAALDRCPDCRSAMLPEPLSEPKDTPDPFWFLFFSFACVTVIAILVFQDFALGFLGYFLGNLTLVRAMKQFDRQTASGKRTSLLDLVWHLLSSLGVVLTIALATLSSWLITGLAICYGGTKLMVFAGKERGLQSDLLWGIAGACTGLGVGIYVLIVVGRRLWPVDRHPPSK